MVDIRRVEKTLSRFPGRFEERCFTEIEQRKSDRRVNRAASSAKRFSAREACPKALGTGFRAGVFWRDQIGRASGREKVGQYVSITVGDVSFKNKINKAKK